MDKTDLLELEASSHLSINELREKLPRLAGQLDERLEQRAHRKAAARLAVGSEKLRELVERVRIPVGRDPGRRGLRAATVEALREAVAADPRLAADAELAEELNALERSEAAAPVVPGARPEVTLAESLRLDEPIAFHPELRREIEAAKVFRLSDAAGLEDRTAKVLVDEIGRPADITERRLEALVADQKLSAGEASAAGVAASLYHVLDERPELVAAARPGLGDVRELVRHDRAAWRKLIEDSKTRPPGDLSAEAYAELLEKKVQRLFPTDALSHRLARASAPEALARNAELDRLRELNPGGPLLAARDFGALETGELPPDDVGRLRAAFDETVRLAHRYPGMQLAEVLDDRSRPAAERTAEVARRVELVNRFFAGNRDVLGADLTPGSDEVGKLAFPEGTSDADRARVLATARTYQRAFTVTDDIADADALVAGGFRSAVSVAMSRPDRVAARTGLAPRVAALYHGKARGIATAVTAHTGTVIDLLGDTFVGTPAGNVSTSIGGYLKEIPGFADFFGNQGFCTCEHCQSILGPAAYFVDLMTFVDENITQDHFAGRLDHPLNLRTRRPDLWTLELTCANTSTPIPYLVVINEILENAVARHVGFVGDFGDRPAVEARVYRDTLPDRVDSFEQPFHLPFEELRIYLRHFERSLADLADAGEATGDALARLRLGLPPRDFELITAQTNTDLAFLQRVYGVPFAEAGGTIAKLDAQLLLAPMGVSRHDLGELIATRYVTGNGAVNIRIVGEKRSAESVQNDVENITGLTRAALDRMHRFVRLWRATGWRIGELDLVLTHLEAAGLGGALDAATVRAVAAVHRLQATREVSVEELIALWSTVPRHPVLRALPPPAGVDPEAPTPYPAPASPLARLTVPLFDRLFNQPSFVEADGTYPKPGTTFLHPALASAPPAATDPNLHRLLASTHTTEDELLQLILGLAGPLGIDPAAAADAGRAFALDERNLALLYRHARLARLSRVTVPELFALTALAPDLAAPHVESLSDLEALLAFHAWTQTTRWSLAELVRILRPALVPQLAPPQPALPDAAELAASLVTQVEAAEALIFADTVFALLPPTSPVATSAGPVAGSAGGEVVTYTVVLAGRARPPETITLAANPDLDAVVADWNSQATLTRAYRSDAAGNADEAGMHLSITVEAARGSTTRLAITASPGALFAPAELRGAEITEAQSRELVDANAGLLETVDAQGRYRLGPGFDPAAPLALPASVDASLEPALRDLLAGYHSERQLLSLLPSRVDVDPDVLPSLVAMLGVDPGGDAFFRELRGDLPPAAIAQLIYDLRPLAVLFEDEAVFDPEDLDFISEERARFDVADFRALSIEAVRNVEVFRALLAPWAARSEPAPDLPAILRAFTPAARFAAADQEQLAALLGTELALLQSLAAHLALGARPFVVLRQLMRAVAFARHVGVGGSALALAQREAYADLATASAAVQAAFRAKYPDEREHEAKVQPFRDAVLSRRRDGLVAYLVHSGPARFDEVTDLYHYFLLDVELEGCARTSRVAAAIDSVQLYVHRCLMNLEETRPGDPDPVHVLPQSIPPEEWDWRKNYRVWEANRKIFLYPENWIEPELRDDKTPLFRQLEEELLSKEITDEAILEAYARYLRGFDELAHLTIAGSYHEKDEEARRDVLHLFGVTADEPPTYYYRRIEEAHFGATGDDRATHWGPWEKMDAQVPVRKVSPIVHRGQLYVFWNRYTTRPKNEVTGGTNTFVGYEHRGYVEFCKRRLDGSWTAPQAIRLAESPFAEAFFPTWYRENGAIGDPIVPKADTLIGFQVDASIMGLNLSFIADPSGHAVIHILGIKVELQLPASALSATGPTTVEIAGNEFRVTPIRKATLTAPLYDSRPHAEAKEGYTLRGFGWDRIYPATGTALALRGFNFQMWSPIDLYRLEIGARYEYQDPYDTGVPWIHPGGVALLIILAILFDWEIDFDELLEDRLIWSRATGERRELHATASVVPCFDGYTFAAVLLDEANIARYAGKMALSTPEWNRPQWSEEVTDYLFGLLRERRIADVPGDATLEVVNGSTGDVVIQTSRDAFYLQSGVRDDGRYHLRRLNTSLAEDVADVLFNRGLDELLATETQLGLAEHATGLNLVAGEVHDEASTGEVDYTGSMGTYLREVFFHIPFLIADHLNSQGRFEEAQRWYHYIFDPTATETITGLPPGLPEEERRRRELDRNWRYREFRGRTLESLRAQLTDARAIEAYRRDPFNPHAVARLRLGAYQKAVIMKYADNLLDWGDDLFVRAFAQLNPEYLREATLKYVTAQEILGARPAQLGDCGEGRLSPKVFPRIQEALTEGSEFLMEMESVIVTRRRVGAGVRRPPQRLLPVSAERAGRELAVGFERMVARAAIPAAPPAAPAPAPAPETPAPAPARPRALIRPELAVQPAAVKEAAARLTTADMAIARGKVRPRPVSVRDLSIGILNPEVAWVPDWGISIARQVSPIFCVPGNHRMLARWDRVEDRLFKLRHCMDIEGTPRQLPLFAPPIDPGLLVAGRAAGLSLDDVLAAAAGNLPPYRFRYLVEKAKAYAATLQAFGAALLAALEKRDAEELARLRNTHQKNILALTTEVKRNELRVAEEGIAIAARRRDAAQYRHDYYDELISAGLTPAEIVQTAARITATVASGVRLGLATAAGVAHLLPQVGSPFAMKYGGKETGDSLRTFATAAGIGASVSEMVATISGIVAGFERREQGWEHQRRLAENDLRTIEKEVAVAELRRAIASRGLELHEKAKDQHDEVIEFFGDKFSNLGLYTYLSRTLQQLHRTAYNNALAIARLAEQAFRFERPGDRSVFVGGEWDASRSGLLAGERLNLALQHMEKRFIETNARSAEINQSFSLMQIDPQALIELREVGRCELALPELFFDMFYPGQYRRRIKAVRLTIPCITGPYTNVSARLTLLRSHLRRDAALGAASLFEVPPGGSPSVATSTAQGDAGVFELSFRDERYMPFEGAGAISEWRLELPSQFRPFDYRTITDVILNLSYTAEEDDLLRQQVESQNAGLAGSLLNYLSNNAMTRVLSLRQEFSSAFHRLIQAPAGTPVTIDLGERHFPLFLQGRALTAAGADLVLVVDDRTVNAGTASISVNGTAASGFPAPTNPPAPGDAYGGLPARPIDAAFAAGLKQQHTLVVEDPGGLAPAAGTGALDPDKVSDLLLVVEYRLS